MLISQYRTIKQLELLLEAAKKNGKGISTTISINDRMDNFGQNVGEWISQTKEEREAKANRIFVGNGKVVFIDPNKTISVAPKSEKKEDNPF
ncbi:MAG: hypothetical protein ACK58Q_02550 [Chitinophagales bacterium]|jgi:hypothetical protein